MLALPAPAACAEEDEFRNLQLYDSKPEAVSASHSLRPASQTAENITVVTSKEIEALNAHTLADVLFSLTGLQVEMRRTPRGASKGRAYQARRRVLNKANNGVLRHLKITFGTAEP